jgi:hypothetical protein
MNQEKRPAKDESTEESQQRTKAEQHYLDSRVPQWVARVATIALILSLLLVFPGWNCEIPAAGAPWPWIKIIQASTLVCWIVVPPLYFWFEYFALYGGVKEWRGRTSFEAFKYGQDISSKIWLAVVTALTALYFGKDIRL